MPDREENHAMLQFGGALKSRRKALGLTQAQAAALAGCGERFVVDAEAGKPSLRLDTLLRLMKTLGLQFVLTDGGLKIEVSGELGR